MPIHPQAEAYIEWLAKEKVPALPNLSPTEARFWDAKVTSLLTKRLEPIESVVDMRVESHGSNIPVRIYTPKHEPSSDVLVYFHGGGWVLGNLDQVDQPCRLLANQTRRIVVSVDYRLAPEHKFPAALEDCYDSTVWISENAGRLGWSPEHLAVCGDSAGGNLAAAVCLKAKDRGTPSIATQVLIYPIVDLQDDAYRNFPNEMSPALTGADMIWFIRHYVAGDDDLKNEYASTLSRKDLRGLPATFLITAEYDILTKQCNAYAKKLEEAGDRVSSVNYPGLIHGFFTLPDSFDAARDAVNRIGRALAQLPRQ